MEMRVARSRCKKVIAHRPTSPRSRFKTVDPNAFRKNGSVCQREFLLGGAVACTQTLGLNGQDAR
jgi:hypothetical protein